MNVIFDLDGTLALIEHRLHLINSKPAKWDEFFMACDKDKPNAPIIELFKILQKDGHDCWVFSGRGEVAKDKTIRWLCRHDINYCGLVMRPVGDFSPDEELKEKWLHEHFPDKSTILLTVDDRDKVVKMWRDNGLTCLQVAPGEF